MRLTLSDIKLGHIYQDAVHRQRGVAVSKLEHLTGSPRVELEWVEGGVQSQWFDVERLEKVDGDAPVVLPPGPLL